MTRLYLVRHGKSEKGFDEALDSPLSKLGIKHAQDVAHFLNGYMLPIPIISSPCQRAVETAGFLDQLWISGITTALPMSEIPYPVAQDKIGISNRRPWLNHILQQSYNDLSIGIMTWRDQAIRYILNQINDAVIFTHYLTINALVGYAETDPRVVIFDPDYCNVTEISASGGKIEIVDLTIR